MCGIAGCFGFNVDTNIGVNIMKDKMKNRGPDNFSWFKDNNLILFHSRLSIIDKSENSSQPFVTSTHVFAYNGELYNYKEIAKKYDASPSIAASDGRVLFSLLRKEGFEKALDEVDGMFALAYYNKDKKVLHLARDAFGEKPLYIYNDNKGKLYFASQINYIAAMVNHHLEINYNMVNQYLFSGYRSLFKDYSETFFKNVQAVEPGTFVKFYLSKNKIKQQTETFFYQTIDRNKQPATIDDIKKQIEYIVETRLRADVPLAFCMSGGVDSNLLISTAKRVFNYDVHGYTIGNTDKRYDESQVVNSVVRQLGIKHTYVNLNKKQDFLGNLKTIIRNNSSPLVTISYYLHWLLLKAISSDGYKVAVSGTGGDELFSGYYDHYLYHIAQTNNKHEAISNWKRNIEPDVRNEIFKDPFLFVNNPDYRTYLYPNRRYIGFSLMRPPEYFHENMYSNDVLKNRMNNELFYETVPPILHDDDLNSMYFSIENRSPLLQKDLWQMSMSMNSDSYIVDGVAKNPLRQVFSSIAPDVACSVPIKKTGFNASLFELFPNCLNYLLNSNSSVWDIVDKEVVMTERFDSEKDSMFLFNLLNIKLFLEMF